MGCCSVMTIVRAGWSPWFRAGEQRGAHWRKRNQLIAGFHPFPPAIGLKVWRVERHQERCSHYFDSISLWT